MQGAAYRSRHKQGATPPAHKTKPAEYIDRVRVDSPRRPGRPSARLPIRQTQRRRTKLRCQENYLVVGFSFDNALIRVRPERPQSQSGSGSMDWWFLAAFIQSTNGLTRIQARSQLLSSYITPMARPVSADIDEQFKQSVTLSPMLDFNSHDLPSSLLRHYPSTSTAI